MIIGLEEREREREREREGRGREREEEERERERRKRERSSMAPCPIIYRDEHDCGGWDTALMIKRMWTEPRHRSGIKFKEHNYKLYLLHIMRVLFIILFF